jgi:hypothetical protein
VGDQTTLISVAGHPNLAGNAKVWLKAMINKAKAAYQ